MTKKTAVSTTGAPAALGPYSQAIRSGDMIYTAGQIPLDPSGAFVQGGIAEQTERVLENLKAVLEAADSSLDGVVKTTVFLKDMNDFAAMNEVYSRYFMGKDAVPPARSTIRVAGLPKDALVEIECIAQVAS